MHKCMYSLYIHVPPPLRKYRGEGGVCTKANVRTKSLLEKLSL